MLGKTVRAPREKLKWLHYLNRKQVEQRSHRKRISITKTVNSRPDPFDGFSSRQGNTMKKIDLETWDRTELLKSYLKADFPVINLGARIDVTRLLSWCHRNGMPFYFSLVHAANEVADSIVNFRWRFKNGEPFEIKHNIPLISHMRRDDEKFIMLEGPATGNVENFCQSLREKEKSGIFVERSETTKRYDMISYSCIPWVDYTHVIRTMTKINLDCKPKLTWGKYIEENGHVTLNFSVQVHHGLMDGFHVGKYFNTLQEYLDDIS
jgi:chloramphenicol O-acetyltransferase type A